MIGSCPKLKRIDLSGCYLKDLSFIKQLKDLEVLLIADIGDIDSLEVVSSLKKIESYMVCRKD